MLTIETLTQAQCHELSQEAARAGDLEMYETAIDAARDVRDGGCSHAMRLVVRAINDAAAQS
jgi:hypothetical protein